MEAKSISALAAILVVVVFAGYIIAGGITGLFLTAPDTGDVSETAADIEEKLPVEGEALGEPVTEFLPEEPPTELKESGLCEGVICLPTNTTCPDREVVSCQPGCDPLTGQCLSCSPDCSEHQDTGGGGGGGGGSLPSPSCSDTSWTPQGGWSECVDGSQSRSLISNCGNSKTETQDCILPTTTIWVSPETQRVNVTDNLTVDVKINTTREVFAVEFELFFDSSVIEPIAGVEGDFLNQDGNSTYPVININDTVLVGITRFNTQDGVSGEGTLATITFSTVSTGTSQLNLENVTITDLTLQPIENITISDGSVEIV